MRAAAVSVGAPQLPAPQVSAGAARDAAHRILGQPQFRQPPKLWLTSAEEWLGRQLTRLLRDLLAGGRATVFGWIVIVLVVAGTALAITRFSRRVQRDPGVAVAGQSGVRRDGAEWSAMAARHAAAGEWRDALRCRYRALVTGLAERGVVDEVPGRTTMEYRSLVERNLPDATADFAGASELFDAAWYGNRRTGPSEDGQLEDLRHRILARAADP